MVSIEELTTFCKKKGFVFPTAEIYGGLSGFFDFGPFGIELKNNIKQQWWHYFVKSRENIVGMDGAIVTNPRVWKASGHIDCFEDIFVEDKKTKERYRADHLVEDALKIHADGLSKDDLLKLIQENNILSPKGNELSEPRQFNLMFHTHVGPTQSEKSRAHLRPETAQSMFTNFKLIYDTSRQKIPFGIAQIGKAFRNEISPRDFLFRSREFEQMEIEYFHDQKKSALPKRLGVLNCNFLSKEAQNAKGKQTKNESVKIKFADLVKNEKLTPLHATWLAEAYQWFIRFGVASKNVRIREHVDDELSHYSSATFDIEYHFPFGWKEIHGSANRGTFDLEQHEKYAKTKLSVFNEQTKERILPGVIEPSWGVDRAFLTFLFDAYTDDKKRGNVVLKLHPLLCPIQVCVFPLVKNKPDIVKAARKLFEQLCTKFTTQYDESGSVGRRYARADELGVLVCCTVDFESLHDSEVTLRHRDTTKQIRVPMHDISSVILKLITGEKFETLGNLIR
jgi:glycyl-tRNA synthetase